MKHLHSREIGWWKFTAPTKTKTQKKEIQNPEINYRGDNTRRKPMP